MSNGQNDSPNYSRYTIAELEDVLAHIDQARFPERFAEAKSALNHKHNAQVLPSNSKQGQLKSDQPPKKWSEQLLITRIVFGTFLVMLLSGVPTLFHEFMTAKSWTKNTVGLTWILALIFVALWFICLNKDVNLMQRLEANWRGKLAIVIMPLLLMVMSWLFVSRSVPLGLHQLAVQQKVSYEMDYRKRSGRKTCRQRVEIIETNTLGSSNLCMKKRQRNSLPEKGKLTVFGSLSQFGMAIEAYKIP